MRITGLALQNMRLHTSMVLRFTQDTTLIVGANASGKTTIIESVALLGSGTSFRAKKIEECIFFDAELARIKGVLEDDSDKQELEVVITRGIVQGKRTLHRLFFRNGAPKRKKGFLGLFYPVVFRPEDLRLIEGSPSRRRSFLDSVLVLVHPEYQQALEIYEKTLVRRNKLLFAVRENLQPRTVLQYWNTQLVTTGQVVQEYRKKYIAHCADVPYPVQFSVEYQPSLISPERLTEYLPREIAAGHTLIGPHKDDFVVFLDRDSFHGRVPDLSAVAQQNLEKSAAVRVDAYGSRGQQRLAVLWLKFCEVAYVRSLGDNQIVVLLDDIFSELDERSRGLVLDIAHGMQTIITTAEADLADQLKEQFEQRGKSFEVLTV